jgi:short-subunit dehydrogenase
LGPIHQVFVSSCSHYFSYPGSCAYGATKDAVSSYAKSIGFALAGSTSVLTVYPGPTDTPQAASASPHNGDNDASGEKEAAAKKNRRSPKDTAGDIWKAIGDGDAALIPGPAFQKMAMKASFDPVWAQRMMKLWQLDPVGD